MRPAAATEPIPHDEILVLGIGEEGNRVKHRVIESRRHLGCAQARRHSEQPPNEPHGKRAQRAV